MASRAAVKRSSLNNRDEEPDSLRRILFKFYRWTIAGYTILWFIIMVPVMLFFSGSPNSAQRERSGYLIFAGPAVVTIPVTTAILILDLRRRGRVRKDNLRLTDRDEYDIKNATEILTVGVALSTKDLQFTKGNCRCGDLIATVNELCWKTVDTDAWHSEYLRDQRAQFDPACERLDIIGGVIDLHSSEQYLGPRPQGIGTSAVLAAREWDLTTEVLAEVWARLCARVAGFECLAHAVTSLNQELAHSGTASRAEEIARHALPLAVGYDLESLGTEGSRNHAHRVTAVTSAIRELVEHSPDRTEAVKLLAPRRAD